MQHCWRRCSPRLRPAADRVRSHGRHHRGAIVGGLRAGLKPALTNIARAKGAREADIRQVEQDYWDKYAPGAFGAALGVVATVALVKGLRKTQGDPYWRVSEASEQGRRSLEIRVSRKDIARFEQALMNNRLGSF